MAAPNTRPVHPCYLSIFEGKAGIEYSTWARITETSCLDDATAPPDLVTAHGSTLTIYRVEESTGKMLLVHSYPKLAGSVCFLETLVVDDYRTDPLDTIGRKVKQPDALVIGFSGHPRLAIVQIKPDLLLATTLLDLTPALTEHAFGATTPLEQDLTASLMQRKGQSQATVSVVLGGGVTVICLQLKYHSKVGGWSAIEEPYVLPLASLAQSIESDASAGSGHQGGFGGHPSRDTTNPLNQSIATGFGDILSTAFLPGYLEPTLVILHANPRVGHAWSGRLGREEGGTKYSLVLTAVTVTVGHQRSALLWSTEVPADAMYVYSMTENDEESLSGTSKRPMSSRTAACLVHCVNSIVFVTNAGQVQQCLATNGWVGSTLSANYSYLVESNPWPFPRLAVQLDGAHFTPINSTVWFVVLRHGEIYLLQCIDRGLNGRGQWAFMSLYQTVGSVGEVSQIRSLPLGTVGAESINGSLYVDKEVWNLSSTKEDKSMKDLSMLIGLFLVASRMGDSSLLGYALEETSVAKAVKTEVGMHNVKKDNTVVPTKEESQSRAKGSPSGFMDGLDLDEDYDRVLKLEEEALYAPVSDIGGAATESEPNVVLPSDDEQDMITHEMFGVYSKRKRARMSRMMVVRSLNVLDSVTALGPLGPACMGPLTESPEVEIDPTAAVANTSPVVGTAGYIFPCGFGSSGGLALMSLPGRDDRTIIAEADCVNAKALFCAQNHGIVFVAVPPEFGGTLVMRLDKRSIHSELSVEEIDLSEWCPDEQSRDFFTNCNLLAVSDLTKGSFLMVVASPISESCHSYFLLVFQVETSETIRMTSSNQIDIPQGDFITSIATQHDQSKERVLILCTITSGGSVFVAVNSEGVFEVTHSFPAEMPMDTSEDLDEEEIFYADRRILAVDIFHAPETLFDPRADRASIGPQGDATEQCLEGNVDLVLDDDDRELYVAEAKLPKELFKKDSQDTGILPPTLEDAWYAALCRQSGELEIYAVSNLSEPVWKCTGCGHGASKMSTMNLVGSSHRYPKGHKVATREMRFFFCGPSSHDWDRSIAGPRAFCVVLETNEGDAMVYHANIHAKSLQVREFDRVPLNDVTRPSQESTKHFSKLRRKRIVSAKDGIESPRDFRHNSLFKFENIQKQHGAFVATSRPFWVVSERGKPTFLYHRSRHVAPAGARARPIAGFCSGFPLPHHKEFGFMTAHERVGRVGSQRITLFDGIVNLNSKHNLLPGGGLFVEKIPFGVTVRRIQFIDDAHVSTGTHPLYAVLVSREYEADQSDLNDDGLTEEERIQIAERKENAKIQRQVEADLGGFDIEQEWVEEIERENCFMIDKELGGAPPIPRSAYALWIVDAANGWQVVDSYELEDDEIGMTMQVMLLSEFRAEPGSTEEVSEDDLDSKLFITLGTGVVDKDGEDVASKGRVALFEVKRFKDNSSLQVAELNFLYDKRIHHGPVTSLSCLVSDGKYRLIIGAGADVNVEQWGNDKLTQVGFFRATMHILDIKLFKNFFILSDAYDSLYFLVWRESDKSLTLLAKDYDPIPVYSTGILSRGGSLDFICHDDRQNLQFFQYSPGDPAARGGNKLVCRADFHIGCQTTDMPSHFCRSSLLINSATPSSTLAALKQQDTFHGKADDDQRLAVSFGTTDGGYSSVVPLSEPVYWRLTALQSVLVNALESDCALSHRAWRLYRRTPRRGGCQSNDRKKGVVDGDLVMKYADLSRTDQEDIASAIGSTVDMILDNLLELRCSAMVL